MSPLVSGGPGAVVAAHFFPHTPAHALRSEHVKVNTVWISCCGLIGGLNFTLLFFRSEHLFSGYGRTRDFSRWCQHLAASYRSHTETFAWSLCSPETKCLSPVVEKRQHQKKQDTSPLMLMTPRKNQMLHPNTMWSPWKDPSLMRLGKGYVRGLGITNIDHSLQGCQNKESDCIILPYVVHWLVMARQCHPSPTWHEMTN